MTAELKLRAAIQTILDRGDFPGPTVVNRELGRPQQGNTLNGRDAKVREEMLVDAGFVRKSRGGVIRWMRS